jgi:hypothetical protein
MKQRAMTLSLLCALVALVSPGHQSLARAQSTDGTQQFDVPMPDSTIVFDPCALGGAGEFISFSGSFHMTVHVTATPSGNVHADTHINAQGVSGVGLTSGITYHEPGSSNNEEIFNGDNTLLPTVETLVTNSDMVAPGPGNNFMMHGLMHVTINANGDATATVENVTLGCQ